MGIKLIDPNKCNGCEGMEEPICVESCPTDVIRFDTDAKKAFMAYPTDCTTCFLCELDCPVQAIYVSPEASKALILPY